MDKTLFYSIFFLIGLDFLAACTFISDMKNLTLNSELDL